MSNPVHCPTCQEERGVAIPAQCPHVASKAPQLMLKDLTIQRAREVQDKLITKIHQTFRSGAVGPDTTLNAIMTACLQSVADDYCTPANNREVKNLRRFV